MRDESRYGLREWSYENNQNAIVTVYEVAAKIIINTNGIFLNFQGWKSLEDFANYEPSLERWNKTLIVPNPAKVKSEYVQFFGLMEFGAAGFLDVSANDYAINGLTIDVLGLSVQAQAQHQTRLNRYISDATASESEFETLKTQHPEIVTGFFGFVWEYAKSTDAELRKFKPVE